MANPLVGPNGGRLPGKVDYGKQEVTLGEARQHPMGFMTKSTLEVTAVPVWGYHLLDSLKTQPEARKQWYIRKLGRYDQQLNDSAATNRIPVRLLATIIFNELLDIKPKDVIQQQIITNLTWGSLGIAQIEVSTALKHKLFRGYMTTPSANTAAMLLGVPQYAIEACAREIRYLLDLLEADPEAPWPSRFNFVPPPANDEDPQRYYQPGVITLEGVDTPREREAMFARMVDSVYNGGEKFIGATNPQKSWPNSWVQGANAETVAHDLYDFEMFGQ